MESFNTIISSHRWRSLASFIIGWIGAPSEKSISSNDEGRVSLPDDLPIPEAIREWHQIQHAWDFVGPSIWIPPIEFSISDGAVQIYSDDDGISEFGIQVHEFETPDPPVVDLANNCCLASDSFSNFVTSMVLNDILFGDQSTPPTECSIDSFHKQEMIMIGGLYGSLFADVDLAKANAIFFAYPDGGSVFGKSRNLLGDKVIAECRMPDNNALDRSR